MIVNSKSRVKLQEFSVLNLICVIDKGILTIRNELDFPRLFFARNVAVDTKVQIGILHSGRVEYIFQTVINLNV